ncbi:MAG: GNAT family N-acetyltransferase [Anaerolineaceae bacterium]|nr:GNAT family N-acetyltransferase [Anaerolineaceae bacterium]
MFENYYLRRPVWEDIKIVFDLMVRCDQRDVGFTNSNLTELRNDWKNIDLAQDAWLSIDKNKKLQGYSAVMPWQTGKRFVVYDAPGMENSDLFLGLTVLCEGRARFLLNEIRDPDKSIIATHISDSVGHQKKVLADAGYQITKYIFNLHRGLDGEIPAPDWPDGVSLRTTRLGTDDRMLHAFVQDAFGKLGPLRQPFSEWKNFMMDRSTFLPHLWFLLEKEDRLIGCVLCFEYPGLGWVRQLAVCEDQRGQGLGRKLLQHVFHVFKKRGISKVGLAAETGNEAALKLYTDAGMRKVAHINEFTKKIE